MAFLYLVVALTLQSPSDGVAVVAQMLLLRYDGFSYREIAQARHINETSVGTLIARAPARWTIQSSQSASTSLFSARVSARTSDVAGSQPLRSLCLRHRRCRTTRVSDTSLDRHCLERRGTDSNDCATDAVPTPEIRGVVAVVTTIGSSADVVFAAQQDSGVLAIRLIPEPELRIRSVDGAVGSQVRPSGLLVNNAGSRANYELDVSEMASELRVSVGERTVFARREGRVVTGPPQRQDGAYVVGLRFAR